MTTNVPNPDDPIAHMIQLRLQLTELERQIDTLKPAFYEACAAAAQDNKQFERDGTVISRRLTPGRWDYPSHIFEQERTLKQLKAQFQKSHEPVSGREVIWTVKLASWS